MLMGCYFLIRKRKQEQPYLFPVDKREGRTIKFWMELFIRASCSRLSLFIIYIVGGKKYSDITLSVKGKLFVPPILSFFLLRPFFFS